MRSIVDERCLKSIGERNKDKAFNREEREGLRKVREGGSKIARRS
jgi:hypothetical protein